MYQRKLSDDPDMIISHLLEEWTQSVLSMTDEHCSKTQRLWPEAGIIMLEIKMQLLSSEK